METITLNNDNEEDFAQKKQKKDNEEDDKTISFPLDIISVILTRLPIKPLLQFRSVSKPWLSLISSPSFTKNYHHRSPSLLITAYDSFTRRRHILSVPHPTLTTSRASRATARAAACVTHLLTLHDAPSTRRQNTELEHLHGLVLLTNENGFIENDYAIVINPGTRKYVKLNAPGSVSVFGFGKVHICYFFGYDEVRNEHKVLYIRMLGVKSLKPFKPSSVEIMLYELSSFTWRKIDVEIPFDVSDGERWCHGAKHSVCVNSVIHVMLQSRNEILAFDLRTEMFEIIKIPNEALPIEDISAWYVDITSKTLKFNDPFLMKVNGFLGVVCHGRVVESYEIDIWMLKDYEERVWVKETIVFRGSRMDLVSPFPLDCVNEDEIAFAPTRVPRNMIRLPIYDIKTRSFKSVKYSLGEQFLRPKTMEFNQIRSYVESMLPLEMNAASTS